MLTRSAVGAAAALGILLLALGPGGCAAKKPPVARPASPPPASSPAVPTRPPAPPQPVEEPAVVTPTPMTEDPMVSRSLDELNRQTPLQPAFFEFDAAVLSSDAQAALNADAAVLKKYPAWTVTIEGHCDERGTAEYNLALGERRAVAAQAYLVSLGIPADRLRTVSYGKEFPFDPGHTEAAWAKNRRAHFVITSK